MNVGSVAGVLDNGAFNVLGTESSTSTPTPTVSPTASPSPTISPTASPLTNGFSDCESTHQQSFRIIRLSLAPPNQFLRRRSSSPPTVNSDCESLTNSQLRHSPSPSPTVSPTASPTPTVSPTVTPNPVPDSLALRLGKQRVSQWILQWFHGPKLSLCGFPRERRGHDNRHCPSRRLRLVCGGPALYSQVQVPRSA